MKDESTMLKESVWVDDKTITECQQCQKPFSVARRKVREAFEGWRGRRGEGGRGGGRREEGGGEGQGGGEVVLHDQTCKTENQ